MRVGSDRRFTLTASVKTVDGQTLRDAAIGWKTSDSHIASIGQDGVLVGGDVGEAEIWAEAAGITSPRLQVEVEKGAGGQPKGSGKGKPQILLSGQTNCPFGSGPVILNASDPLVYQRPYKPDHENNVFWINLQHPVPIELLKGKDAERSVAWRTYHFQRVVDVYTKLLLRAEFADDQTLNVDQVLEEVDAKVTQVYEWAKAEIFDLLFAEDTEG